MLLLSLLEGRGDTGVLCHNRKLHCSCGEVYQDVTEMENHLVRKHPRVNLTFTGGQEMALAVQDCILGLKKAVELVREREENRSHSTAELARGRAKVNNNFAVSHQTNEIERDPLSGGKGTTTSAHRSILPKPIASKSNTYCLPTGRLVSESSLLSPGVLPPNANVLLKTQQKTSEPRNHRITTQQKKSKPQKDQVVLISSTTEEGKNCRFKKVEIPQRSMVVLVEEEDQIVGSELTGLRDAKCVECFEPLANFTSLKAHYKKSHPWQWGPKWTASQQPFLIQGHKPRGKAKDCSYLYFCPIPGCGHHILNKNKTTTFFTNKHLLSQHYVKVHSHRSLKCEGCSKRFPTKVLLNRHASHCKNLVKMTSRSGTSSTPLQLSSASMATHGSLSRTAETASNLGLSSPGRQLSAALAMAELSSVPINPAFHAVNSNQGNGNNSTKASGTSTEDQLMFSVAVSAASTVTTTREFGTDCGGLVVDESGDGVEKPRHPPRLGEIEQLSTETQTDEFDALMGSVGQAKPSASHSGSNTQTLPSQPSPEDPEDPFGSHVGMPEDVLDILCSNYTQTCADLFTNPAEMMLLTSPGPAASTSASIMSTPSVGTSVTAGSGSSASVGTHTDLGGRSLQLRPRASQWNTQCTMTNTETQTRSDDLFG